MLHSQNFPIHCMGAIANGTSIAAKTGTTLLKQNSVRQCTKLVNHLGNNVHSSGMPRPALDLLFDGLFSSGFSPIVLAKAPQNSKHQTLKSVGQDLCLQASTKQASHAILLNNFLHSPYTYYTGTEITFHTMMCCNYLGLGGAQECQHHC